MLNISRYDALYFVKKFVAYLLLICMLVTAFPITAFVSFLRIA